MDTSNQDQEMNERFLTLPKELQDLILSPDLQKRLDLIIESLPLKESQRSAFGLEVVLVLMRFVDVSNFTTNIVHNVKIPRERAEKISKSVAQEIFFPVMDLLTETNKQKNRPIPQNVISQSPERQTNISAILKGGNKQQPSQQSQQKRIEQKPLAQPQKNIPRQTLNQPPPAKAPVAQVQNQPSTPQASNVFANKLSNPTLMKNEEEKVEVENKNDDKPKHVDPYREPIE